jgi:hypothetical protein
MHPALLLATLPVGALALAPTHGVAPDKLAQYAPSADGTWRCLTTAMRIPWTAVNDDYCDCDDGSDEPGVFCCVHTAARKRAKRLCVQALARARIQRFTVRMKDMSAPLFQLQG